MKKAWILKAVISFPLLLLLGGCWDRIELDDMALISALAFDEAENNEVRATVQVILPQAQIGSGTSGGGTSPAVAKTTVQSETGIDIADALSKLQRELSRDMFWGQCRIFIFSEAVAKSGIRQHLDYLVRFPESRERAYMFVSKGEASKALEVFPKLENSSAEVLRRLADLHIGIRVTLHQLSLMLNGESQAAILPMVHILPEKESAKPLETIPYLMGSAIFRKDRMIGELSEGDTRGVMWLRDEIKEYTVVFKAPEPEQGIIALKPVWANIKLIPKIEDDVWKITVKVVTEGDIIKNSTSLNPMDPSSLQAMNRGFKNDVYERIKVALDKTQREYKIDILDFAREFHRKYPKQWEKVKDNWEERFPEVQIITDIETKILRPGLISSSQGDVKMK
ncbi:MULTISPECIES: Ger(x)C family spore germination protein [unclassified Paenibacillus]|uniref:Ger(x)C family spore germination protein n=1 Tax=unclassified Paenibacillus TaxID=185978 RepID=UPI000838724E|nr:MULTISPECIES: Ger(x)C family spore germination protein [unclassified Paenibacillus]NWL89119.1 Ger(x)C family spore germination protein [Paenibacillus sp. 79R4]